MTTVVGAVAWWTGWGVLCGVAHWAAASALSTSRLRSRRFRVSWAVAMTVLLISTPLVDNDRYFLVVLALNGLTLSMALIAYISILTAALIPLIVSITCLAQFMYPRFWNDEMFLMVSLSASFFLLHGWIWCVVLNDLQSRDLMSIGAANADRKPQPF